MKRRLVFVLALSLVLPAIAFAQTDTDTPADPQATKAPRRKHVSEKDDITAIGTRGIGSHGLGNWYSLEKEIAIGKEYAKTMDPRFKFIKDPLVTEYVDRIGQKLAHNSDARVPFIIKVIDSGEVNAFSLPGGYLYVNYGVILEAESEAELAGVMAHEIAHVAARHGTRQITRHKIFKLVSIPLVFVGGGAGYALQIAVGLGAPMSMLKFSRGFEAEADYLALQYVYAAGYDPQAFISLLDRVGGKAEEPGKLGRMFSTHPKLANRVKNSQDEIVRILPPRHQYIVTTSDFDEVKDYLAQRTEGHKAKDQVSAEPTLRHNSSSPNGDKPGPQDDDRPTLRRRPKD